MGEKGLIVHSENGGKTWTQQRPASAPLPPLTNDLADVFFVDAHRGWVVGNKGTLLVTTNGGSTWQEQTSGTSEALISVNFTNAKHGWAVGSHGTILATTDGGRTWQAQTSGAGAWLGSVHFTDAERGWVVGLKGTILTTADGGRTWLAQAIGARTWLESIHFTDTNRGWATGLEGTILATTDGGNTWRVRPTGTTVQLHSVYFTDADRGWAAGEDGTILATTDGGNTWRAQTSGTSAPLTSVHFTDFNRGWAVGWYNTILATADGGNTWRAQASDASTQAASITQFQSVHFTDAERGWVVGVRVDGIDGIDGFMSIFVNGLLGNAKGTILATTDGGRSWQPQTSGTKAALRSVHFTDAQRGWAVAVQGAILATTDGGRTWQTQTSGTFALLFSVYFTDAQRGWAVGDEGTILATADGGTTWLTQTSGTTKDLRSVHFTDAQRGWTVGDNSTILTTADGGTTWENIVRYRRSPAPWVYAMLLAALSLSVWALRRRWRETPTQQHAGVAGIFVSDRPLAPGDPDHMGHGVVARGLADFIRNENTEPGLTVAVTGVWGSGKSSIMGLLAHDLQRAGFRTAWFNAWHHQQEGRQLASMLNAIRRQAIPHAYTPAGLWVRLLLLWQRGWFYRGAALLLLAVLAVAVWDLNREGQPLEQIQQNFAFHVLKRQPTVVTESTLNQLAKEAVVAADTLNFMRGNMLWRKGLNQDSCSVTSRDDLLKDRLERCVFESHEQLLTLLEQGVNHALSAEERTAIARAAQHLPPPPLPTSWSALAGLFSVVLLFFVGKGTTVYGLDVTRLLGSFIPGQGRETGKETVGTLEHFRHEFRLITETLRGRLVLFIDDLDRCDCATVREVLDMVNYLTNTGRCFIVLGMAMEHIECCIEPKGGKPTQADYANQYLKKLINIEVPVPTALHKHSRRMLERQAVEMRGDAGFNWRRWCGATGVALISTGVIALGIWLSAPTREPLVEFQAVPPQQVAVANPSGTSAAPDTRVREPSLNLPESRVADVGVQAAPATNAWPQVFVVLFAIVFVMVIGVGSFLPRDRALRWLARKKWLARLKVYVGGAERTIDSPDFVQALLAWHGVITMKDPTPRGIKRFVNRVRFFAMRERAARDEGDTPLDDATLVALAALHHVNEKLLVMPTPAKTLDVPYSDDNKGHPIQLAVHRSIKDHTEAGLPWPPTQDQRNRFNEMAHGISVR